MYLKDGRVNVLVAWSQLEQSMKRSFTSHLSYDGAHKRKMSFSLISSSNRSRISSQAVLELAQTNTQLCLQSFKISSSITATSTRVLPVPSYEMGN